MSLKAELETWAKALKAYDDADFEMSLDLFSSIADSSKILTNMGLIYATLGEHEAAVEQFIAATALDQYLAVAYFQCGVSNFLLTRYDLALKDFEEALLHLRGNQTINYEQLGLKFKLFSAEVLFNKGLSKIYMGRLQEGLMDMEEARREKVTDEHNVIDDAIQDRGEGYTVFSIPVGVLYRPSEKKLKNSQTKDYMGKAKLVAAAESYDAFTTFSGATRLKQGITPTNVYMDKPDTDLGPILARSATVPPPTVKQTTPPGGLERANTTLNVATDARGRNAGLPSKGPSPIPRINPMATNRSPPRSTSASPNQAGPTRGLTIKKTSVSSSSSGNTGGAGADRLGSGLEPSKDRKLSELYGGYLDSYTLTEEPSPPPVPQKPTGQDRTAEWARSNANPAAVPPLAPMQNNPPPRSAPPSSYAPSSFASFGGGGSGGGSLRRKLSRRPTAQSGRRPRLYEEEEEGYVSGEYEDGPYELVKIRVKLHYQDDVRGMALTPETPFEEFISTMTRKFNRRRNELEFKFTDEDGIKISLRDESDYDLAIETARESSKGKPEGKLEVWCIDV